ncbi:MAG TPA: inositol monophosphatase family protein [Candidatus Dormibacteraeota bacterium]|nr:inositol monophosphatase family protein [Candidatus Dormibacteraeota bacterium]
MRKAVMPLAGTEAGRKQLEMGAGGDRTMEVDRAAEDAVLAALQRVADRGERFSVLSEEAGLRSFGAPHPLVVVDPVDGSLNAKQGIPFFNVMLALLSGPTIGDTVAGTVVNLISGERWTAVKGLGAEHDGKPLHAPRSAHDGRFELLGLESSTRSLHAAAPLVARATKVRILGSMALSMAHTAAGGLDVFCAPVPMRVFDMTAGLLLITEAGGVATDLQGGSLSGLECTLMTRTTLLCAPDRELHQLALRAFA